MLSLILTTTNSILRQTSCKMEEPRVISGFKWVAWPELRRLPLKISSDRLPAGIKQVGLDIEPEANRIIKEHGLQFEDEGDRCDPQMEMRGVPGKSGTSLPTILILAPWSTEKKRDWGRAAQEMAMFLADLSRVCSFGETDIHVEIMAPELVQPTHYTNIDDPVYQSAWEYLSSTILSRLQSLTATQGHITCLSLQKYGTDDCVQDNPPTVYISVDHDSDETQWPEVVTEVKRTLDAAEWDDVQVHIEHNQGMLRTSGPEPTWRTFILTSYQAVRPAFDGFTVTPDGADSSVAPPTANSDLWTVDSVGYTPDSSAKPTTFESPPRSKHHFNIFCIDEEIACYAKDINYLEKTDWPKKEKQLQDYRQTIAALRDERKQKTEFFEANKKVLGSLRMDWALIELNRPWHDRLPEYEDWKPSFWRISAMPFMTFGMQLEEQTRSIEALSDLEWSNDTFDVYKIGSSSGPKAGSLLCTNNLVTIRDDQYMNPSPTEEMAFETNRYDYPHERGFCAPGDSGSVVFDEEGGIVGLMIGGHKNNNSDNHGYGYVTPIEYVFKDIKDLLKGRVVDIRIAKP
ncbi:hypothetical protein F25303_11479 [Fusarium sp. NRRL 25303]|nr:hypothetical protein F25303_11479 [Fusarium sp. NRRL 25303]